MTLLYEEISDYKNRVDRLSKNKPMYNNAFKNLIKLFCLDNTINDKVQETKYEVMDIDGVEETKDDSIQVENKDGNEQDNKIPYAVEIYKYKEYKNKKKMKMIIQKL